MSATQRTGSGRSSEFADSAGGGGGGSSISILGFGADLTGANQSGSHLLARWGEADSPFISLPAGVEENGQITITSAGTIKNLRVRNQMNTIVAYTVQLNQVDTTLLVALAPATSDASDTVNSFAVVAGDKISVRINHGSGSPSGTGFAEMEFESTAASGVSSKCILGWGGDAATTLSTPKSLTRWGQSDSSGAVLDSGDARIQMPFSGTLKNLRFRKLGGVGAGTTHTATVRIDGADSSITASILGVSGSASDSSNSVAVNAGNLVEIKISADFNEVPSQSFNVDLELDANAVGATLQTAVFDLTHTSGTFDTGALGFTPLFCHYVGAVEQTVGNFAHMTGFASGTGTLAKGSALQFDAAGQAAAAAPGAVGGVSSLPPGNSFVPSLGTTLSVTQFDSSGIILTWSGSVTSHQGGLLVVGTG